MVVSSHAAGNTGWPDYFNAYPVYAVIESSRFAHYTQVLLRLHSLRTQLPLPRHALPGRN